MPNPNEPMRQKTAPVNKTPEGQGFIGIRIHAHEVVRHDKGEWMIYLPIRPLSDAEREVLNNLFPHSEKVIEKALAREALINALITEEFF